MENNMAKQADYDLIREKVHELRDLCAREKVPMMAVFAREDETGTVYEREIITPRQVNAVLSDDRFSNLNVAFTKGFCIRIKNESMDGLDMSDALGQMMDWDEDDGEEIFETPELKPKKKRSVSKMASPQK